MGCSFSDSRPPTSDPRSRYLSQRGEHPIDIAALRSWIDHRHAEYAPAFEQRRRDPGVAGADQLLAQCRVRIIVAAMPETEDVEFRNVHGLEVVRCDDAV